MLLFRKTALPSPVLLTLSTFFPKPEERECARHTPRLSRARFVSHCWRKILIREIEKLKLFMFIFLGAILRKPAKGGKNRWPSDPFGGSGRLCLRFAYASGSYFLGFDWRNSAKHYDDDGSARLLLIRSLGSNLAPKSRFFQLMVWGKSKSDYVDCQLQNCSQKLDPSNNLPEKLTFLGL